ncbi:hypothetical protein JW968_07285 [Candidatus Woesearchaeota archaeon]|nr:hypothetical protein [Candidatus Woesearchaeota archaeon]
MGDISKKTVLVLLILTICLSVFTTWAMWSRITETATEFPAGTTTPVGQVKLGITGSNLPPVQTTGRVALEITNMAKGG